MSFLRELGAYVDDNYRARGNRSTPPEKSAWGCMVALALLVACIGGCVALTVRGWL